MSQNAKHILFLSIKESVFFAEQKKSIKKAETPAGIAAKPEISNYHWLAVVPKITNQNPDQPQPASAKG